MFILLACETTTTARLQEMLEQGGHACCAVPASNSAAFSARVAACDGIILEVLDVDPKACEAIRAIRLNGIITPIVLVASRASPEADKIALDQGADVVLVHPVSPTILMARLRAILRRCHKHAPASDLRAVAGSFPNMKPMVPSRAPVADPERANTAAIMHAS